MKSTNRSKISFPNELSACLYSLSPRALTGSFLIIRSWRTVTSCRLHDFLVIHSYFISFYLSYQHPVLFRTLHFYITSSLQQRATPTFTTDCTTQFVYNGPHKRSCTMTLSSTQKHVGRRVEFDYRYSQSVAVNDAISASLRQLHYLQYAGILSLNPITFEYRKCIYLYLHYVSLLVSLT